MKYHGQKSHSGPSQRPWSTWLKIFPRKSFHLEITPSHLQRRDNLRMSRTICWLNGYTPFPDPRLAADEGLLAVGGDLSFQRLLSAYAKGIFPWYNPDEPILWWSPNPRMVLYCDEFKVSKSLAKKCRQIARHEQRPAERRFWATLDQCFLQVMSACASTRQETGTWIHPEMVQAYYTLHLKGRSEEHTSELQSRGHLVCRLLLEKKKLFHLLCVMSSQRVYSCTILW